MAALTRREFLKTGAVAAGALAAGTGRVEAAPARFDGTIRFATIGFDLLDPIRKRAEKDLGLKIVVEIEGPPVIGRWVRQEPGVFDVLSGFNSTVDLHWPTGNLQPVEIDPAVAAEPGAMLGLTAGDHGFDPALPDEASVLVVVVAAVGDQRARSASWAADAAADGWHPVE